MHNSKEMIKKISDILLLFVLAGLLVSPLVVWIVHPERNIYSFLEGRRLIDFPTLNLDFQSITTAAKRTIQGRFAESRELIQPQLSALNEFLSSRKKYEKGSADHFPFRLTLIQATNSIERAVILAAYDPLPDKAISASARRNLLVLRDQPVLFTAPTIFDNAVKKSIDKRIENFNQLMVENPNVNFHAYYIDRIISSPFNMDGAYYPLADNEQALQYFEAHKPAHLIFAKQMLTSFDDYLKYFYHTDHHWNEQGAWKGYLGVYDMIAPNYSGISPKLTLKGFVTVPGANFCGSYARSSLYPCTPDPFRYPDVELPPYKTVVDGKPKVLGTQEKFRKGIFSKEPYADLRTAYWGGNFGVVQYKFENNTTRNAIIISDSYAKSLDVFIAAHFHNVYSLDLRYIGKYSLNKLINEFKIKDVIILGSQEVLFSTSWLITP